MLLGLRAAPKEEAGVSAAEATYGHSLVLPSQLQPPPRAPQAAPEKVDIPSTIRLAKEKEGGGSHRTAGCHVPQSLPRAGEREEEAAAGDRSHADVGLSGSAQAAHRCSDPSSGPAAPTWASAEEMIFLYIIYYIVTTRKSVK